MDYFVVRQSWDDREKLFKEIKQGRLRQGWSSNNRLSLDQAESTFIENYSRDADQSAVVSSRYAILRPLRFVKPGDIIVVPKQPDYDRFLVLTAAKNPTRDDPYSYDFSDPAPGTDDFRSVVNIDRDRIKTFHFDGATVPPVVKQKLRSIAYSKAVNVVGNEAFIAGIRECLQVDDNVNQQPEPLKEKLTTIREKMYRSWVHSVRELTPSDFEKLVRLFMLAGGYEIVRLNHYDGEGLEVDLECERTFELDDRFGTSQTVRYRIQIKKHAGKTDERAVRQLLDEPTAGSRGAQVVSIVISTADDFTEECKQLAYKHGILLMHGIEFARAYFRFVEKEE
jgi:Restriction endonuclease